MQTDEVDLISASYAFAEARLCAYKAAKSDNAEHRQLLLRLRNSWIMVANELQMWSEPEAFAQGITTPFPNRSMSYGVRTAISWRRLPVLAAPPVRRDLLEPDE